MRTSLFILFLIFFISSSGQSPLSDTIPNPVVIRNVVLSSKIVRAEYGKVIMYFNQLDYLKREMAEDTIVVTPKYFDESAITELLKQGKTRVYRRITGSFIDTLTHRIKRYGSMADRVFAFTDGVSFFMTLELIGILDGHDWMYSMKSFKKAKKQEAKKKKPEPAPEKKFEYEDEFPDMHDTLSVRIKDYFPPAADHFFVYDINNGYGEKDTLMCKQMKFGNKDVFYFVNTWNKFGLVSVGTTSFGKGLYFYRNDSLFTIEKEYERDIDSTIPADITPFSLLLPARIKPGDSTVIGDDFHRQVFIYLRQEDVSTKEHAFEDCIKIKILDYWPTNIYLGYIWLQKSTGLVKWMRGTGKVEDLVESY